MFLVASGLVGLGLAGCETNQITGKQEFRPWTSLQNADKSMDNWLDRANGPSDPQAKDWANPD